MTRVKPSTRNAQVGSAFSRLLWLYFKIKYALRSSRGDLQAAASCTSACARLKLQVKKPCLPLVVCQHRVCQQEGGLPLDGDHAYTSLHPLHPAARQ